MEIIMQTDKIKTYTPTVFHKDFFSSPNNSEYFKTGHEIFFIAREENLIRQMKLPILSARMTSHALMYITSGVAEMKIGSATYKIHEDECWVVPAGKIFSIGNVDVESATGFICGFSNDIGISERFKLDLQKEYEFLNVWGNHYIALGKQISSYVKPLFERLFNEYSNNGLSRIDIIQSYLFTVLSEINQAYQPLSGSFKRQALLISNKFKELLFANIKTKHFVSDYASLLNVSPNHLNKVIKEVTGQSPSKHIEEALIMEAKILLYQTNLPVSEVASEIGIFDQSYFTRLFKKHEKQTPLQFRKMIE